LYIVGPPLAGGLGVMAWLKFFSYSQSTEKGT